MNGHRLSPMTSLTFACSRPYWVMSCISITSPKIDKQAFTKTVESEKKSGGPQEVNIQWFGNILNWFGPLLRQPKDGFTILDKMRIICSFPYACFSYLLRR